ncbi:hypothetical protein SLS62_004155 [Diatrype stigma]|uniref:Uncharacterized protein n=1 Tax=Diatrype stigma TaxID=117547 RepID=A0AAN9UX07_9PEZI
MISLALFSVIGLAMATAVPESLKARIPPGVDYTPIAPGDIPEEIKSSNSTLSPSEAPAVAGGDLQKRATLGVYLCTDANWSGYCVHITAPDNVCVPLAADLNDLVSSVGPDSGAYCRFYL